MPSSARSESALRSCFVFVGSFRATRRRISGAKLGRPVMVVSVPSDRVSPTRSVPWFGPGIREANDVAGEGFVSNLSLAGEKEDGAVDGERDARVRTY
jgi:hypothetical protein